MQTAMVANPTISRNAQARRRVRRSGSATRRYIRPIMPSSCSPWAEAWPVSGDSFSSSHGATTIATKNENSMAAEALAGMGLI
ncbi:hypothetical protein GALL_530110 [mine drainage metagenome]|uniref:Uncharacterized protein n=1 Tax=mine drainage metagenome TaxID=410659 RepID=A0A1J5P2R5_9ZZZZ